MEKWSEIPKYNWKYHVSTKWRVMSAKGKKDRILKNDFSRISAFVWLYRDWPHKEFVKYLVAEAFIPNPKKYEYVYHKDWNVKNLNVENLEWWERGDIDKHNSINANKRRCHCCWQLL